MTPTSTLSGTMEVPIAVLLRAAALMAAHPDLRAVQEMIVTSVQVLDAVRLGVAEIERLAQPPRNTIHTAPIPAPVVDLAEFRAARGDGAVRL